MTFAARAARGALRRYLRSSSTQQSPSTPSLRRRRRRAPPNNERIKFALDNRYGQEREGTRVSKGGGHVDQIYTATLASTAAMWHMRSTTRFE